MPGHAAYLSVMHSRLENLAGHPTTRDAPHGDEIAQRAVEFRRRASRPADFFAFFARKFSACISMLETSSFNALPLGTLQSLGNHSFTKLSCALAQKMKTTHRLAGSIGGYLQGWKSTLHKAPQYIPRQKRDSYTKDWGC